MKPIKGILANVIIAGGLFSAFSCNAFFGIFSTKSSDYINKEGYQYFEKILSPDIDKLYIQQAIDKLNGQYLFKGTNNDLIENFIFDIGIYKISNLDGAVSRYGRLEIADVSKLCLDNEQFSSPSDLTNNDQVVYFVSAIRYYVCGKFISWNKAMDNENKNNK